MKLGFSSICCPAWDLKTIFEHAVRLGFDGIEFRGLQGELHLPNHPELTDNSEVLVEVCRKTNIELVCLGTSASFGFMDKHVVADHKSRVREHLELAHNLCCPFVRVFTGDIPSGSSRSQTLGRIAEALSDLRSFATRHKVAILVENSGDLSNSKDLWFLLDAVSHPAVQACWNPVNGFSVGDRATIAVPRLGSRLGMVHVADASFDGRSMLGHKRPGDGDTNVARLVELLTGIAYDGYLMLEWPKLWDDSLAEASEFLPAAAEYLRGLLSIERKPLPAYKGDKNPPKYADRTDHVPTRS